ncbi:hypothetical protein P152DRAFT_393414 [Eremomyces bilateralis CBS 781.70]|uniref:Uncharacterized protein n=1 Tax=Eremomyces bilateralis CBS 781.70 TaxID=1392243 RepID=A0A6G1G9G4_9PEZI|nr:uncharacterized protein P152DRAFT_393414 [Eremomyces bilateralis CBS 781.70]KAF1814509.1 hypothetical protein P152DRAFT_393414 [Eremomyces bilateralis CBS 781.70]
MASNSTPSTTRSLHMTGPATYPSSLLTSERTAATTAVEQSKQSKPARPAESSPATSATPARHFNTSRALKAVNDTSPIDFAYLPEFDPDSQVTPVAVRVPLLPVGLYPNTSTYEDNTSESVMRPEIFTASADGTHISAPSAFADIHDNGAGEIDYNKIADGLSAAVGSIRGALPTEEVGMVKQVWHDLLDDVLGPKKSSA